MEVVQGKSTDKKIVIAQEIAFAKVLSGNNKTLRDRAIKKLKKWLTIRGNGKWAFTEDEFIRIWTGLFYCMWMSDKFLIQEELAEAISSLIHCFKKNTENALLFVKCFNKRILLDWDGLDQYRIDKFNMLIRRFLRQTFIYCREKDWEESLLHKLMGIFYNVVLHRESSLGFVMHFISIYAEELAKVSKGKIEAKTVLTLVEPFVRLIARSKDERLQKETEEFFYYLMRQTDAGIEFEEKFNAWKEQGFPGEGPHCMVTEGIPNGNSKASENEDESLSEEEEDEVNFNSQVLDPRAGSVHVFLPQIPIDLEGIIDLFRKHKNSKFANAKGRRILNVLINKYETLNRGRFPSKIRKDPILTENKKKKKRTLKNATELLNFTKEIDQGPIKTEEFEEMRKELERQDDDDDDEEEQFEIKNDDEEIHNKFEEEKNATVVGKKQKTKIKKPKKMNKNKEETKESLKKHEIVQTGGNHKENRKKQGNKKKEKRKSPEEKEKNTEKIIKNENAVVKLKKKEKINGMRRDVGMREDSLELTAANRNEKKRKILSSWQVQEVDPNSPEYYKIETPKIIRLERKINESFYEEEESEEAVEGVEESEGCVKESPKEEFTPVFWERAKAKLSKKNGNKCKVFMNPFANLNGESKASGRRISFALDKNMAQENEEYLEEVKNSPSVPFDGSKKPVQSALKSGLSPSPVNPFYRFKKIKF